MIVDIKNREIQTMAACLKNLDRPSSREAKPYRLKAVTRQQIVRSLNKMTGYSEEISAIRDPIVKDLLDEQNRLLDEPSDNFVMYEFSKKCNDQLDPFLDTVRQRTVYQIDLKDLDLDQNPIPAEIISPLLGTVILDEEISKEEEQLPGDPPPNNEEKG